MLQGVKFGKSKFRKNQFTTNTLVIEDDLAVNRSSLTSRHRDDLDDTDFAIPESRRYPIADESLARNALMRAEQYGSERDVARVRKAVFKRYPALSETNNSDHGLTCNVFEGIRNSLKPATRHEILEGRNYIVAPMIMLTEGVHAGSNGPLYYPRNELEKTPAVWNHKPIVVYHPTLNGQAISACEPAVISRRKVGIILNTEFEAGKKGQPGRLKAEAWLEINRLKEVDDRILNNIEKGEMTEISTGLFTDNEQVDGQVTINGKKEKYEAIARNYRADHLAILPDEKGACSIADGAGLLRNSAETDPGAMATVRANLSDLLKNAKPTLPTGLDVPEDAPTVRDVYPTFCVYGYGDKLYKQGFKTVDDQVSLIGGPEEVETTYTTRNSSVTNNQTSKGVDMPFNKKQFINGLISNVALAWTEKDRDFLLGLEDVQLVKLQPLPVSNKNPAESVDSGGDADDEYLKDAAEAVKPKRGGQRTQGSDNTAMSKSKGKGDSDANDAMNKTKPKRTQEEIDDDEDDAGTKDGMNNNAATPEEALAQIPEAFRDMFAQGLRSFNQNRFKLIKEITANKACVFSKEQLVAKDMTELNAIAALARSAQPKRAPVLNYNFAGLGEVGEENTTASSEEPLEIPVMNFEMKRS
jgi:hypothetical protein